MSEPYYQEWMQRQGIPTYSGYALADIPGAELSPWEHIGGLGAFVQLRGMEGFSSCFLAEVPANSELRPQQHIYQQFIYVLSGRGRARVRKPDDQEVVVSFGAGDLFATPLNAEYVISNEGSEPCRYLSVNDAHVLMDIFHGDEEFIFRNPWTFQRRFDPWPGYYESKASETIDGGQSHISSWVPDVPNRGVDRHGGKGGSVDLTTFELAQQTLAGHIADWPVGEYHQAHHHLGGAVLLIVRSVGYTLMWPQSAGVRPYEAGNADMVVTVDWEPGTLFSPPTGWFHQHFNVGDSSARQLAFRGSGIHPSGMRRGSNQMVNGMSAAYVSLHKGGNLIEYRDEDPQIRQDYEERRKQFTAQAV